MEEQAHPLNRATPKPPLPKIAQALPLLNALGIDVWVPRQPLQGRVPKHQYFTAAAKQGDLTGSSDQSISASHGLSSPSSEGRVAQSNASVAREQLLASVNSEASSSAVQAAHSPERQNKATPGQRESEPALGQHVDNGVDVNPFECLCLFYRDWVFMDDVSGAQLTKSAYVDWQLAILRALGLIGNPEAKGSGSTAVEEDSLRQRLPIRRLRWPPANDLDRKLAKSNNHDARNASVYSDDARHDFIMGWMERQQSLLGRDVGKVVLLGKASQVLLGQQAEFESESESESATPAAFTLCDVQGSLATLFPNSHVLCAPSSQQLWQSAALKREFWLHLSRL